MAMQAYVEQIGEKQGQGRNGPYTMFSVKINGEWLGHGFKRPECRQGDFINYDIEQKGNYKNIKNISICSNPSAGNSSPASTSVSSSSSFVDTRDISIRYQSCRKDALQLTDILLRTDSLKLPAKQADKVDAVLAFVNEITNQYYITLQDVMDRGGVTVEDLIPQPENE